MGLPFRRMPEDQAVSSLKSYRTEVRIGQALENPVRAGEVTGTLCAAQFGAALLDSVLSQRGGALHAPLPSRRTQLGSQCR